MKCENLVLTEEWDKVFDKSDKVHHEKVTFINRYGITLAADLYKPLDVDGKLPAIACAGPFGAVKEQVSGLYAQTLAEMGFLTIAFDPSFTGESGGEPRFMASPDINTEDFQAAVDFLATNDEVDADKIGICGICGWGGMALNAASLDTRIKATVTSTMYNMTRQIAKGYNDEADTADARHEMKVALNSQRTEDYKNGEYARMGGVVKEVTDDLPQFVKDYHDFYIEELGYHPRSPGSNDGWNMTGCMSFISQPIIAYSDEIRSAVLIIHGENAHSRYFSEDEFAKLTGDNKELMIIPDAVHTDLYYKTDVIPFEKIVEFYRENL
ncbi:alpha/beta hydrolase [Methanobrevibacter sp. YE315]|uniref:alpha/beta hydrolase n=1 Tax=Methanobrevibacter sp. YE315 TaxID=1609968 RepID=UPI000764E6EE|nr:alpha/beta hydrolase [Methanobrevibacter sp. YE315]AMD17740.1 alpha/beta hydrolase [Methanobrevibacter sp. YE315]